jgi:hypothetical protein
MRGGENDAAAMPRHYDDAETPHKTDVCGVRRDLRHLSQCPTEPTKVVVPAVDTALTGRHVGTSSAATGEDEAQRQRSTTSQDPAPEHA